MKAKLSDFVKSYTLVDNDKLESYIEYLIKLKQQDFSDSKIPNFAYLDVNTVELLRYAKCKGVLDEVFLKDGATRGNGYSYQLNLMCSSCDQIDIVTFNKTQLLEYLSDNFTYKCDHCKSKELEILKIEKQQKQKEQYEEQEQYKIKNTQQYIDEYLNPNNSWSANLSQRDKIKRITRIWIDDEKIANYIKSELCYGDFLLTPYWKAIAVETKRRANFECQLCGSSNNLATHHKTYKNHGYEHRVYKEGDLIVLCDNCHKKFHEIVED